MQVLTYHAAKGLEWPMVVCAQVDKATRASVLEPTAQADGEVDWKDPLAGRWIRLWPWPYGRQATGVHLDAAMASSEVGQSAARRAAEEAVRLLYVGVTRPRDHLVLALPADRPPAWLRELDVDGDPRLELPAAGGDAIVVGGHVHPARSSVVRASDQTWDAPSRRSFTPTLLSAAWPPLELRPSAAAGAGFRCVARHELGARVPLTGSSPEMSLLGEAVHACFASDRACMDRCARVRTMAEILARWSVSEHVDASDIASAADRLWAFLAARHPGARLRREWPVHALSGSQVVVGRIDLLVEGDDWFGVIDHKVFPGRKDQCDARAASHGPQLALYADAVTAVTGSRCIGTYVHLPMLGTLIQVAA